MEMDEDILSICDSAVSGKIYPEAIVETIK